jgi:hypothetical protein
MHDMSGRRPSNLTVFARLIAIAAGALLLAAQPAHAFDPSEWEYVDRVEFVRILQNTRTGEYMTTVVAGGPFQTLAAARAAARRAIAEYERMMAEARREVERWRRAWDEYMASGEYARDLAEARAAWNEAMASRHAPWPEPAPDRSRRSWRRDPAVRRYFDGFDENRDGAIDWGEIETFQQTVFETFQYRSNRRVLDPAEFMRYGGGDYVLLDYWKIGGTIDRYDTLTHVARVDGVVGEPW